VNEPLRLVVITGPTATGKTGVGIELARLIGGEVVSADSMMIYRRMDIGTAKPSVAEMQGVPHHLIDVVDPGEEFSVAAYQAHAEQVIADIDQRGAVPLLVGGTGLYVRSVIDHYDFAAPSDIAFRAGLLEEARRNGVEKLHARLGEVDPATSARLHVNDKRRIIRALEVHYLTGRPISAFQDRDEHSEAKYRLRMFGLNTDREVLYRRIEDRVDQMLDQGLVGEVAGLLARGYTRNLVSMKGLGYKEIAAYLEGEISLDEAAALLKRNTRRFAKRQLTWFRRDQRICWIDPRQYEGSMAVAEEITKLLKD
jgi:tRNA dimethylallyltransferase